MLHQAQNQFNLPGLTVHLFAPKWHRRYLKTGLTARGANVLTPIPAELGYGRQMAWLHQQVLLRSDGGLAAGSERRKRRQELAPAAEFC